MTRLKRDLIITGLGGESIDDLVEGWSFHLQELAPYVFRVDGKDRRGHTVIGVGHTADEALDDCEKRAKRIDQIQKDLASIKDTISRIFRFRK